MLDGLAFKSVEAAEVAAQLAITPKAAKSLLYRTRNLLRAQLTPILAND